jgi:hypothetical protein
MQSEAINELAGALAKAQGEFPPIIKAKSAQITATRVYHYADLADILAVVRPVLSKHGLAIVQAPEGAIMETAILHSSGQWKSSAYPLTRRDKPQEMGSEITYARRYALCSMLGLAGEDDDDGKSAQDSAPKPPTSEPVTGLSPSELQAVMASAKARWGGAGMTAKRVSAHLDGIARGLGAESLASLPGAHRGAVLDAIAHGSDPA